MAAPGGGGGGGGLRILLPPNRVATCTATVLLQGHVFCHFSCSATLLLPGPLPACWMGSPCRKAAQCSNGSQAHAHLELSQHLRVVSQAQGVEGAACGMLTDGANVSRRANAALEGPAQLAAAAASAGGTRPHAHARMPARTHMQKIAQQQQQHPPGYRGSMLSYADSSNLPTPGE